MKAVLISIQPKWCELIASGKKTVEVRKTKPKLETPFKVYIYCSKPKGKNDMGLCLDDGEVGYVFKQNYKAASRFKMPILSGKVIGEFVCDRLTFIDAYYDTNGNRHLCNTAFIGNTRLTDDELFDYLYGKYGRKHGGWAWRISNLVIYDEPKELSEFHSYNCGVKFENGYPMPTHEIKRPPQSWCYVEESEVKK